MIQRKFYLPEDMYTDLQLLARATKKSITQVLRELLADSLKRRQKRRDGKHNGKKIVRVVDDTKKKTYHETEVQTGMEADGGLVEVISGLDEGQEIITFIKK